MIKKLVILLMPFQYVNIAAMEYVPKSEEKLSIERKEFMEDIPEGVVISMQVWKQLDPYKKLMLKNEFIDRESQKKSLWKKMYESTDPSIITLGILHFFVIGLCCVAIK